MHICGIWYIVVYKIRGINMSKERPQKRLNSTDPTMQNVYDHPAYGLMRVSNCHGGRTTLLGSDLIHDDYITLEIAPAELHRSYGENLVFGQRTPIIKVAMTHAQFGSISQSIGNGQGTPVTIQYAPSTMNQDIINLPDIEPMDSSFQMSKDELNQTLKKHIENALKSLSTLKEAVESKKTGKAVIQLVHDVERQIELLPLNLRAGVEFANEVLNKSAHEAQANAESVIQLRLKELGVKSLGDISHPMQIGSKKNMANEAEEAIHTKD